MGEKAPPTSEIDTAAIREQYAHWYWMPSPVEHIDALCAALDDARAEIRELRAARAGETP